MVRLTSNRKTLLFMSDEKYELDDAYALGVSYIEAVIAGDDELAETISSKVTPKTLQTAFMLTSTLFALELHKHAYPDMKMKEFFNMARFKTWTEK